MRRNHVAVAGVVCALIAGGITPGCSSREDSGSEVGPSGTTTPAAEKLMVQKAAPSPVDAAKQDAAPASESKDSAAKPTPKHDPAAAFRAQESRALASLSGPMPQRVPSATPTAPGGMTSKPKAGARLGGLGLSGAAPGGGGVGSSMGIGGIGTKGRGGGSASYGAGMGMATGSGMMGKKVAVASSSTAREPVPSSSGEGYTDHGVNPFVTAAEDRLSTFAVDVDTGSYTLARRKLLEGALPPREAVRVEEFLNYFRYTYPAPAAGDGPLAVHLDAAPSPYTPGRHLLRVGVQGKRLSVSERKPAHLTFLVDVSGSMQSPDRLPLAKRALRMLVDNLRDGDTVALVTYAGSVRKVLGPTGMEHKALIHSAIEDLSAGGSTAMASGIDLAYLEAMKTLKGESVSRVIILSDGDANVGTTSHEEILKRIRGHVKEGITLTTVGFGMGNYQDTMMEQLANQGNGNHYYVDSLMAARRIFQEQLGGTLEVIAQDVKLQVEFDPAQVARYRLVGYENRDIADRDFRNDKVDAGEIGSGHTVTALYEVELKPGAGAGLATVRVRAKRPRGEAATERAYAFPATALAGSFKEASADLRFAAAVMGAAELFRRSPHADRWSIEQVREIARAATPAGNAEREEFLALLEKARPLLRSVAAR